MGDGELNVRINMTEMVEAAWNAYQEKTSEILDPRLNAKRKNAFVSGIFAGLEIGRGVALAAREAAHDEHSRVIRESKALWLEG